jgi:hypothetical protein
MWFLGLVNVPDQNVITRERPLSFQLQAFLENLSTYKGRLGEGGAGSTARRAAKSRTQLDPSILPASKPAFAR